MAIAEELSECDHSSERPSELARTGTLVPIPAGRRACGSVLPAPRPVAAGIGLWRSLVAHLTGGQGVAGSNPVSPTNVMFHGIGDNVPAIS